MRSEDQKQASRSNGAKSNGPKTEHGKERSSQNGMRHNLASGHLVLLSTEDPYEYIRQRDALIARFNPIDGVEMDLVDRMLAASWREQRVAAMESALVELEILEQRAQIAEDFDVIDGPTRHVLAFLGTTDKNAGAALLTRYAAAAGRAFARAYRILRDLQGDRFDRKPAAAPPQPAPKVEAPAANSPASNPESVASPQATFPRTIVFQRRRPEILTLQTEPEIALAAGGAASGTVSSAAG